MQQLAVAKCIKLYVIHGSNFSRNFQMILSTSQAKLLYLLGIATNITTSICAIAFLNPVFAVPIPQGFQTLINDNGVAVYKKDYANIKSEYVTVVNTAKASINNLVGEVINTPNGTIRKNF